MMILVGGIVLFLIIIFIVTAVFSALDPQNRVIRQNAKVAAEMRDRENAIKLRNAELKRQAERVVGSGKSESMAGSFLSSDNFKRLTAEIDAKLTDSITCYEIVIYNDSILVYHRLQGKRENIHFASLAIERLPGLEEQYALAIALARHYGSGMEAECYAHEDTDGYMQQNVCVRADLSKVGRKPW